MSKLKLMKKFLIPEILIIISEVIIFSIITIIQYNKYIDIVNFTVSKIVNEIITTYSEIKEEDIVKLINSEYNNTDNILKKYGYQEDISYIKNLEKSMNLSVIINGVIILIIGIISIFIIYFYIIKQNLKIKEINEYFQKLNNKNYELKIADNGEDELSKLRNELYKTTILLKETAENSEKEKKQLENSLADISHQLKTPITSIRIMLDNIYENPDMDENIRYDFIKEISKQVDWISSLVISLLKLAKFDSGSIIMNDKNINLKKLIEEVISNLSIMIELKSIEMVVEINENIEFYADYKWQLEALTNIIKNSIEHSNKGTKIYIKAEDSSLYLKVSIKDEGEGINKKDKKHIFERFYKTKKSGEDSIGIGLSLAKTIIEKENGYITVESEPNEGTEFIIKYIK